MDAVEKAIRQRRSVRKYRPDMPDAEDVRRILAAGTWAPSGLNNQPWKFMLVKGKQHKDRLAEFTKYSKIIENAPLAICVFLDKGAAYNREKDIMAVGACVQNILLFAHKLGYGTCWLGEILNRKEQVQKFLKSDSDCELMAVITMGYPAERASKGRRKTLKHFILK
ncbi:MAG: nitroreductase family protein [Candidatus Omnitrophica bacterium]|nr:nitroreductase family protein [Candidatus Omnitrophota bacterium]